MAIVHGKRLWAIKIGYDEKFSRFSPGTLLINETIRYAFEQGLEALEFPGSEDSWKRQWTHRCHQDVTAHIYPYTPRGLVALCFDLYRFARKKTRAWRNRFFASEASGRRADLK